MIQFHLYLIFQKKKVICTYCIKKIYYKILIWQQKLFYLLFFIENNEFLQFYLQKYFNSFSFKKEEVIFTNYLKQPNFICKINFN